MESLTPNIANQSAVQVADNEGDTFPSGSILFLLNAKTNFEQGLKYNPSIHGAETSALRNSLDFKWIVRFAEEDRSKIAIKSALNGRYLAPAENAGIVTITLTETKEWWLVRRGAQNGTFCLGVLDSPDLCLRRTNSNASNASNIGLVSRENDSNSKNITSSLSWQFQGTPEYLEWKHSQEEPDDQRSDIVPQVVGGIISRQTFQEDQHTISDTESYQSLHTEVNDVQEIALRERGASLDQREQDVIQLLGKLAERDFYLLEEKSQLLVTKERELYEKEKDLIYRQEAVEMAEQNVFEVDNDIDATAGVERLEWELKTAKDRIAELEGQLKQLSQERIEVRRSNIANGYAGEGGPSSTETVGGRQSPHDPGGEQTPSSIRTPIPKRSPQELPYDPDLIKRFEDMRLNTPGG